MATDEAWNLLHYYRNEVIFALEVGEGPQVRGIREKLAQVTLDKDQQKMLALVDSSAIDVVINAGYMGDYLLIDDANQAISKWWWHLGKIRTGTYPEELLGKLLK